MECHSCKQFLSGNHPDVIWVTHEKPASIGVDDVRIQINDTVSIRPYSSPYKIYLVDEAEKMTVQAQNALLKTIEEPPAYAVLTLLKNIKDMDIPMLLDYIRKLQEDNLDLYECLDFMQLWYRDILMFKVTKDMNSLIFKDEYSAVSSCCQKSSYEGLEEILSAIEKAKVRLNANVNTDLALELMLLTMKEN